MSFTIYKIYLKDNPELFYIGSTNNYKTRKRSHKSHLNNKICKSLLYKTIRTHGGYDNMVFEKLEDYKYTFKDDYQERMFIEEIWIRHLQPTLNTRSPCKINWKEYFKDFV